MSARGLTLHPTNAARPDGARGATRLYRSVLPNWIWAAVIGLGLLWALSLILPHGVTAQPAEPALPQVDYDEDTMLRSDLARKLKACRAYEADLERLQQSGIREQIERGPEWARQNLPRPRLLEIKRYLEAEEQVRFRCGDVFAAVSVIRAEQEARRRAAIALARQRAYDAWLAEQLARIEPPERKPRRFRRTASSTVLPTRKSGVPPLPVRRIR